MSDRGNNKLGWGTWILGVALALVLNGCGNVGSGYFSRVRGFSSQASSGLISMSTIPSEISAQFSCASPALDNVQVQQGRVPNSRNTLVACPHSNNTTDVALMALTTEINICVIPVQQIDEHSVFVKQDLASQLPLFQCGTLKRTATLGTVAGIFNFASTNYNAVIVTRIEDRDAMLRCLTNAAAPAQGLQTCPEFAYGKFRENRTQ